jgi:hypothetical protein
MTNEETPIACTLATDAYRERLAWIARLNEDGLQSCRRRANILELRYKAAVRERVYELMRREAECCGFLRFEVAESDDGLRLTIKAPEEVNADAAPIFEPFLTVAPDPE